MIQILSNFDLDVSTFFDIITVLSPSISECCEYQILPARHPPLCVNCFRSLSSWWTDNRQRVIHSIGINGCHSFDENPQWNMPEKVREIQHCMWICNAMISILSKSASNNWFFESPFIQLVISNSFVASPALCLMQLKLGLNHWLNRGNKTLVFSIISL